MRIALSGKMTSGKSLIATFLEEKYGFIELSFAGRLKELASELFSVKAKSTHDRMILQQLAYHLREIDPYVWVRYLVATIPVDKDVIVSDVRYPNEFETLKRIGFVMVRMLISPEQQRLMIEKVYPGLPLALCDDYSEVALDNYKFDYYIDNDKGVPLKEVYRQVNSMLYSEGYQFKEQPSE